MSFEPTYYPKKEEKWNVITHGLGALLSFIALPFMIFKACKTNDSIVVLCAIVYGVSMVVLYTASTLFHITVSKKLRYFFNVLDHAAIYVLIAGTYAPITLIILGGTLGWVIFGLSWFFAVLGVVFKLFFMGRFKVFSILTYVAMGWMIIFAIKPLLENFSSEGLQYLGIGCVSYSIGALFFALDKIPFNHAVFHVFVLLGSLCHFIAIYSYVL